jgi:hypothetical protein
MTGLVFSELPLQLGLGALQPVALRLAAMREPGRSERVIQRGRRLPLSWTLERHVPGVFSHWSNPMDLQRLQRRSAKSAKSAKSALNRSAPVSAEFVDG